MLKTSISDLATGKALHVYDDPSGHPTLVTTNYGRLHGAFATTVQTGDATDTVVEALGDNGIVLTDLIVSTQKAQGGVITIQFTDGVNTVVIVKLISNDAPLALTMPFQGNWTGWQGCDIQAINSSTGGSMDATVAVGYYRTDKQNTPTYAEWDARR